MTVYEHHGLEADFLKLRKMKRLNVNSEERKRKIIGRCNWYMFCSSRIRGVDFQNSEAFYVMCHRNKEKYPSEQNRPNKRLANVPPHEFLAKYHKAYRPGTKPWMHLQDLVPAETIQQTLSEAWEKWQNVSTKAKQFEAAINSIPHPERIKKVVCLGLGCIHTPTNLPGEKDPAPGPGNRIYARNISQHLAAIAMVKIFERKTGREVPLYTADPDYGPEHKKALETLPFGKFIVLDSSYSKHEQFTMIDDKTFVFNMTGPPQCPAMRIIQEFARPVAFITKEVSLTGPFQDRLWFEVTEEDGNKVEVPGCAHLPGAEAYLESPKRVRDMIVRDYKLQKNFPAEENIGIQTEWGASDLIDYTGRAKYTATIGAYWFWDTRLYVRQDGIEGRLQKLGLISGDRDT
ncbi:hypothetical protein F5Y04DRAFT_278995 [Hypomontagnella monticulosa]|nr:hypothetical protein F5Y04DRAFT_278995 [Hypomontagnella monticulosa]